MSAPSSPARPPRSWIPWAFVGFFVAVFAANGAMVYLAFSSWTGISTEDAYRRGITYNQVLADAEAHKALGWRLDISFVPEGRLRGRLRASLVDRAGAPLVDAAVTARLVRPTHEGYDQTIALAQAAGADRYEAEVAFPLPGQWEVRARARKNGKDVIAVSRLEVPQ